MEKQVNKSNTEKSPLVNGGFSETFTLILSFITVAVYMLMSYLLIFSPLFVAKFSTGMRIAFGILFFVYGIFRTYRIYKKYNDEEQ